MSLVKSIHNVAATATRLKEGSLEALGARIEKLTADMTDIEKAKVEIAVLDAFTSVSARLDQIEMDREKMTTNSRQRKPIHDGFLLPKGDA